MLRRTRIAPARNVNARSYRQPLCSLLSFERTLETFSSFRFLPSSYLKISLSVHWREYGEQAVYIPTPNGVRRKIHSQLNSIGNSKCNDNGTRIKNKIKIKSLRRFLLCMPNNIITISKPLNSPAY